MGLSYKPDTSDIRNSKAIEIAQDIASRMNVVEIYDPIVTKENLPEEIRHLYCNEMPKDNSYEAVVTLVKHSAFKSPRGKVINLNINK